MEIIINVRVSDIIHLAYILPVRDIAFCYRLKGDVSDVPILYLFFPSLFHDPPGTLVSHPFLLPA